MRQHPFGTAIKDVAAIAVTGGAAATERVVVQQIEAKMVAQAANSLGKSAEKMAIDNAEHIFAKGRFDGASCKTIRLSETASGKRAARARFPDAGRVS